MQGIDPVVDPGFHGVRALLNSLEQPDQRTEQDATGGNDGADDTKSIVVHEAYTAQAQYGLFFRGSVAKIASCPQAAGIRP